MLDFGALPPEINSARMYAGPGSASFQAAASAWNSLAAELNSAAIGYERVITQLASEEWLGAASTSMANAATPYIDWMSSTATQAEHAATQARAAAAAYEEAFAATVPPPVIAANRGQLMQLVATNVLGQNTSAIAQLEAQYGQMWAQDAAAMYSYAGRAAAATTMATFTSPVETTNAAGQAMQAAAVTQAAANASGVSSQSLLQELTSRLPSSLESLAAPATSASSTTDPLTELWYLFSGQTTLPTSVGQLITGYSPYSNLWYNTEGLPYFSVGMGNFGVQIAKSLGWIGGGAPAAAGGAANGASAGAGAVGGLLGGGGGPAAVSAGLGNAPAVGGLSVPPSWMGNAPLAKPTAPLPISSISAAPEIGGAGNLLGGMPLAGTNAGAGGAAPRYGVKPTVMARPPFAG
ncbi:PPE family protein [Mycobacterium botniense]|uniref:PPE family protein n=1 Tax=Mycobacterium botniense TaxID=84962 RepID=A0A7I9Y136_9MYCO|nr:PPE family protein [Mycobacterium botniense]GFG75759.1 PPE family protein [Mycobacterium botniense]